MKGMIFMAWSVKALDAGQKRMTRRIAVDDRPRYVVGDVVYVKETWRTWRNPGDGMDGILYAADDTFAPTSSTAVDRTRWTAAHSSKYGTRWRSPVMMPRWAARYELMITGVRKESVQAITEEDALAEGVTAIPRDPGGDCWTDGRAVTAFQFVWNELHGWHPNAFERNDLVWVYSFQMVKR